MKLQTQAQLALNAEFNPIEMTQFLKECFSEETASQWLANAMASDHVSAFTPVSFTSAFIFEKAEHGTKEGWLTVWNNIEEIAEGK